MQTPSNKREKVSSKNQPKEPKSLPNENKLMQTFYGKSAKLKKMKNEKDNIKEFYKPL